MKKRGLLLLAATAMLLSACGAQPQESTAPSSEPPSTTSETPSSVPSSSEENNSQTSSETPKLDFTDVYFDDVTCVYDTVAHILGEVRGAPAGTTITYSGREQYINAGTYPATAKLVKEGYNDKTL